MFVRTADDQPSITRAWAELEEAIVSLRGRKFYGMFDHVGREYRACVERQFHDDPEALGLELGTLPGGRYARERLRGGATCCLYADRTDPPEARPTP